MVPAKQRLEAGDLARPERDDRLVVHPKCVLLNALPEIGFDLQLPHGMRVDCGFEDLTARFSSALRAMHSDSGVAQRRFGLVNIHQCDSNTHSNHNVVTANRNWRGNSALDALSDLPGILYGFDAVQQHRKFVSCETGSHITRPKAFRQGSCYACQQFVSDSVPQTFVDHFETIDVDDEQREVARSSSLAPGSGALQPVEKRFTIRQTDQRIVGCRSFSLPFPPEQYGDCPDNEK